MFALVAAVSAVRPSTQAQTTVPPDPRLAAFDAQLALLQSSPYRTLQWSPLGPTNVSGRCTDVTAANRGDAKRLYVGFATGGVWQTDNGVTWQAIFNHAPTSAIGDIAVAPSNPDIVWIGTGEANLYRVSYPGVGLYRSTDAGRSWQYAGLSDSHTIARIVIDPVDPNIVYVAAGGHKYTDNEQRGVFKTTDGGRTWRRVLFRGPRTGAIDLVIDPSDRNTLYAATWERIASKWSSPTFDPANDQSSIFETTDAGGTWREVANGLPPAKFRGRIGIDVAASNPRVVYAYVDNGEVTNTPAPGELDGYGRPLALGHIKGAEVYRSDDGAATWKKMSRNDDTMTNLSGVQGFSFGQVRVDPTDENTIYLLGVQLLLSHNAGRSFESVNALHPDHHGFWFDPTKKGWLVDCNDGGVYQSLNNGGSWSVALLPTTQFYNVELDTASPFHVYGSAQDAGSYRATVALGANRALPRPEPFDRAVGGEATNHAVDPVNPDTVYTAGFYGNFSRYNGGLLISGRMAQPESIKPRPKSGDPELRGQWLAPILISPLNPSTLYAGYQSLYRSRNRGSSWDRISPDMTDNDPHEFGVTPFATNYQTITSISESPRTAGLIYAGTDDGHLRITKNGGAAWTDLTANLPKREWISRVVASKYDEGTVYIAQRGREDDDLAPYLYRSTDYGQTITPIVGNIPFSPVNVIREDPIHRDVLYAGTDLGVYVSRDGGEHWDVLGGNLPTVPVADLQVHERDRIIVIATFGRGIWVMDESSVQ